MKASTFANSILVVGLLASCAIAAEVRTWTDASGKTLSGSLEEITSDGKVKINSNGQTFTIPLERFSEADQEYVDSQKGRMEEEETSTRRRRKSDLFDYRQWKDKDDNEVKAKYVRIFEGQVVLLQGRTAHKLSFYDLSEEDQIYLRGELETRGEANQIPPPAISDMPSETGPNAIDGGNQPYDPRMGNQVGMALAYAPPPTDDFGKKQQETHIRMRREIERQQAENRRAAEEAKRKREELERRPKLSAVDLAHRDMQEFAKAERERDRNWSEQAARNNEFFGSGGSSQTQRKGQCTSCKKTIIGDYKAGDRCPHCNVFFTHEVDEFGNTTNKVPLPWYFYIGPLPIGLIIWAVVAFFRKISG
ncbi:hypothetical protein [Bremerella alba]|uniref:SLA1 homology domain-containing protein n=1 Tax=Bremerella alba TaxID=980252 RepID=A0A7V9A600_9BACT|nr:hypothetical protein [Bremerella alba]MBA2113747.1 hypothetical protein [Bremerella alba]